MASSTDPKGQRDAAEIEAQSLLIDDEDDSPAKNINKKKAGRPFSKKKKPSPSSALEISDDEPWKNMDVGTPSDRHWSESALIVLGAILMLFPLGVFVFFHANHSYGIIDVYHGDSNNNDDLVPPIFGRASLSPAEFRDVRTARPGESVLVTGGLGFIGSHVVDLLLHRGFLVTILDDESNGHNHNQYAKELVPHDITIVGDLPHFPVQGESDHSTPDPGVYTHVIHLAAAISVAESMNDPDKYERINYGGSQKVLKWIEDYNQHVASRNQTSDRIRKLVAASSAAIYGDPDPSLLPLRESAPYGGLSPYADTKYRMEGLMSAFVKEQNDRDVPPASATALRFFNVYGPRQDPHNPYSGVISLFLEKASTNNDITILGDGEMTRDFVYVKDVARAIVMNLLKEPTNPNATFDVYNVCTGKSITINTLANQVKSKTKSKSKITHLDPRDGDIRDSRCNPTGGMEGVGFVSAVPLEVGLQKTVMWFQNKG